ncbi:adhesion G protein-coupled receptor B2 [Trichonephila clavipes]|nr:adhesion G protein-coupled receptor B2 [Trichonephila clavipes]
MDIVGFSDADFAANRDYRISIGGQFICLGNAPITWRTFEEKSRYRTLNCNETTMYYSIDMNFFYSKDNLVALHLKYDFWRRTATAGSDVVQSGRPIFDDFFQHLWPYIGNNTANVVFQMVKRLWLIRIDQ